MTMSKPTEVVKLAIKDFSKKKICEGHLYLSTGEGRKFYLMKPGIYIDEDFIKKYAPTNSVFDFVPLTDEKRISDYVKSFRELRYLQFERDLRFKAKEIVTQCARAFSSHEHFLNFAIAAFQEFNNLPLETVQKLHETDMNLFRKALYSSAFSVVIALTNDYYHYPMIKDFYNLTLGLDFGLCDKDYSYYVAEACNHENLNPGSGVEWLKENKATDAEMKNYLAHPQKSYEFFKSNPEILAHSELKEIALYQHELTSGKGFPRGLPKGQVSGWEAVVILADSLVEIQDDYLFEVDVFAHIENIKSKRKDELPIWKVYSKLVESLKFFNALKETGT
jgi:HD domain